MPPAVKRLLLPLLCAALLGFAQFGALTHAVWHAHADPAAAGHASGHGHDHGREQSPTRSQSDLCAFHAVFAQVLGGTTAAVPAAIDGAAVAQFAAWVYRPRHTREGVPAISRGPPALL